MAPAIKCLIVLAIVALLFITELIPLAITAMSGAIACPFGFYPGQTGFFRSFRFNSSTFRRYVRSWCCHVPYWSGTENRYFYR